MGNKFCTCKETVDTAHEAGEQKNPTATVPEEKTADEYPENDTPVAENANRSAPDTEQISPSDSKRPDETLVPAPIPMAEAG